MVVLCCTEGEHANGQGVAIRTSHSLHALSCTGRYVYIWEMWDKNHSTNFILSMYVYQHVCVVHIGVHIQMYTGRSTQFTLEKTYEMHFKCCH